MVESFKNNSTETERNGVLQNLKQDISDNLSFGVNYVKCKKDFCKIILKECAEKINSMAEYTICPLTGQPMMEPVSVNEFNYEQTAVEAYVKEHGKCPKGLPVFQKKFMRSDELIITLCNLVTNKNGARRLFVNEFILSRPIKKEESMNGSIVCIQP